jgi:hypothetical protein
MEAAASEGVRAGRRGARCAVGLFLALLVAAPAAAGPKLQLYVMPDTQAWAWNQDGTTLATWRAVAAALCEQRSRFAMVLHTGDLVDHPDRPAEWRNAQAVLQQLDACGMPHAIAFGNHDFDNHPPPPNVLLQGDRGWQGVMAKLARRPLATAPSGRGALHELAPGWFVLATDFVWNAADRNWMDAEITKRADARFLVLSHQCANASGIAFDWCRQLFEAHPQIRVAVSGHWLGAARDAWRSAPRKQGPALVTLFSNYQHVPDLAAWGLVIELDPATGALCVHSENPLTGATGHPAAGSKLVGSVAASPKRTCFDGAGRTQGR